MINNAPIAAMTISTGVWRVRAGRRAAGALRLPDARFDFFRAATFRV